MGHINRVTPRRGRISRVKVLWPLILIGVLLYVALKGIDILFTGVFAKLVFIIISLVLAVIMCLSHNAYVLNLIRTGEASFLDIITCAKEKGFKLIGLLFIGVFLPRMHTFFDCFFA